jgi:acyl-CoA synthetase (AMP-forming)/AMP-acid ligase II
MGKIDSEGFVYVTDRKRDIVISGGENIYPVEVEETLHNHPKVFDVAVIGIPDERLGEIAAAVIQPRPGMNLTEEEVRDFCKNYLPHYKQPKRFFFDKVPRNPTGKIEKPKLRQKYSNE